MQLESLGYGCGYSGLLSTPDRSVKTWPEHRAGKMGRGQGGVSRAQAQAAPLGTPATPPCSLAQGSCAWPTSGASLETRHSTPVTGGTI